MPISDQMKFQGQWLFKRRGHLPIILLLAGLVTHYFTIDSQGFHQGIKPIHLMVTGIILSLVGMAIRVYTVGFTADFTSGRNTAGQVADQLNTTGIYSVVRHPLYLGNFIIYLGIALVTSNLIFVIIFTIVFFFYYERIIYAEESFLQAKFGEKYLEWSEQTPTIIPAIGKYQKPSLPFNWWKAFEREKSGIMSYFIVLFVFQLVRCFRIDGNYITECGWAFVLGILATAYYFTMKLLSKKKILVPI